MTQKAVKAQMIDARLIEVRAKVHGTPVTVRTAGDILEAITTLYITGLVDIRFLKNITYFYNYELEDEVYKRAPYLFQKLSAKGKIVRQGA